MTIFCLYSRSDGTTTITPVSLHDTGADPFRLAFPTGAGATIMSGRKERQGEWHNTPMLAVTVVLEGQLSIETNRRTSRVTELGVGDVLLVLDRSGEGHRSRGHGPTGLTALLLPLAESDVSALSALFRDWPADFAL